MHAIHSHHLSLARRGFIQGQIATRNPGIHASSMGDLPILPLLRHVNRHWISTPETDKLIQAKVSVGQHTFQISKFLGSGVEGSVFEGYDIEDSSRSLVILKFYNLDHKDRIQHYYNNEKRALWIQSRLIAADFKQKVLVSKKIQGSSLDDTIISLIKQYKDEECAKLLNKYLDLLSDFRQNYKLVHGDAHPENVIVDDNGDLHLIDFGSTIPLSKFDKEAETQIVKDEWVVVNWVEWYTKFLTDADDPYSII